MNLTINNVSSKSNLNFGAKISFDPYVDRNPSVKVPTPYEEFVKGLYYLSDEEVEEVGELLDTLDNTAKGSVLRLCPCSICKAYNSSGYQYDVFEGLACLSDKWEPKKNDPFFYDPIKLLNRFIGIAQGLEDKAIAPKPTPYLPNDYDLKNIPTLFGKKRNYAEVKKILQHDVFQINA